MKFISAFIFDERHQPKETKWFKNALSTFVLYKLCAYAFLFTELFSSERIIYHSVAHVDFWNDISFFLNNNYSKALVIAVIIGCGAFSILELFNKSNYIFRFLLWLSIVNINSFLYSTHTGGDYLLNQLLFFNIFISTKSFKNIIANQFSTAIHNTALIGAKVQVCLLYLLAGWFKLTDVHWLNGSAIYQVFHIPEFSNSFLKAMPYWICSLSTYFVLFYQLSFSMIVWYKPTKKYFLLLGVLQHLVIAFGMGLFSFGMIMILSYILFLDREQTS